MLEFLLAGAKFLVSKSFRDSMRELSQRVKSSPDWKKDVVEFKATIKKAERELSKAFGSLVRQKLLEGGFSDDFVGDFLTAFYELTDNGFTHGCLSGRDSITVRVILFGVGASGEVINNTSKKVPNIDTIRTSPRSGPTRRGFGLVLSVANQVTVTNGGRGIKIVVYKHVRVHHLAQEGITFVNVGGFSGDVATSIKYALFNERDDVIIVFGPEVHATMMARTAEELDNKEFVGRFALVMDKEQMRFLSGLEKHISKLIGCFSSPEEAVLALRPDAVIGRVEATSDSVDTKGRTRKPRVKPLD